MVTKSGFHSCLYGALGLVHSSEIHLLTLPLSGLPTPHLGVPQPPRGRPVLGSLTPPFVSTGQSERSYTQARVAMPVPFLQRPYDAP